MGFTIHASKKALKEKNNDANQAMEWLFSKMDDPTINDPYVEDPPP